MENSTAFAMYLRLFNRVTDAIAVLEREKETEAKRILIQAQLEGEETYLDAGAEKKIDNTRLFC